VLGPSALSTGTSLLGAAGGVNGLSSAGKGLGNLFGDAWPAVAIGTGGL
jgi:hypothetical protein